MKCDRWRDWILLDADGALASHDRDQLWAHLGECADCRRYAGEVREVLSALAGEEAVVPVPAALERRLARLAATVKVHPLRGRLIRRWPAVAAAAALLVAVALALVLALRPSRPDRPGPEPLPDLVGIEIDQGLAAIAEAVDRLAKPGYTPVARLSFDDELDRIGSAIEVLDRPIFEDVIRSEEGGNG